MTTLLLWLWLCPAFISTMLWAILTTAEVIEGDRGPGFFEAIETMVGFFVPAFNFLPAWFLLAEAMSEFRSAY